MNCARFAVAVAVAVAVPAAAAIPVGPQVVVPVAVGPVVAAVAARSSSMGRQPFLGVRDW